MQSLLSQITNLFASQSLNTIENNELITNPAVSSDLNSDFSGLFDSIFNENSPANFAALNGNTLQATHTPISFQITQFALTAKPDSADNTIEYSGQIINASVDGNIKQQTQAHQLIPAFHDDQSNNLISSNHIAKSLPASNQPLENQQLAYSQAFTNSEKAINSLAGLNNLHSELDDNNQPLYNIRQSLGIDSRNSLDNTSPIKVIGEKYSTQDDAQHSHVIAKDRIAQSNNVNVVDNDLNKHTALVNNTSTTIKSLDHSSTAYSVVSTDEKLVKNTANTTTSLIDTRYPASSDSQLTGKSEPLINEKFVDKPISTQLIEGNIDTRLQQVNATKVNQLNSQVDNISIDELPVDQFEIVSSKQIHNASQLEEIKRLEPTQRDENIHTRSNTFDQDRYIDNSNRMSQRSDVTLDISSVAKQQDIAQDVKLTPNNATVDKSIVANLTLPEQLNLNNKLQGLDKTPLKLDSGNSIGNGENLAQQITWAKNNNASNIKIAITPEHLGALEIDIETDRDGLNIQFVTQNSTAKEALETFMPRLKDMLEQNGLNLQNANVSQQDKGHGQNHEYQNSDQASLQSNNDDQLNVGSKTESSPLPEHNTNRLLEAFA